VLGIAGECSCEYCAKESGGYSESQYGVRLSLEVDACGDLDSHFHIILLKGVFTGWMGRFVDHCLLLKMSCRPLCEFDVGAMVFRAFHLVVCGV
jgi:hypothetical protein